MQVTAVVINWKRPANVSLIAKAFKTQTVPCELCIIDAGGGLPPPAYESADQVIILKKNVGPYNRFAATNLIKTEFVYFHDDDMLPGSRLIEHFLKYSNTLFSTLGQHGRNANKDLSYNWQGVNRGAEHIAVNNLVRSYFVHTDNLPDMKLFEQNCEKRVPKHDDLMLCFGIRKSTGKPCLLTPWDNDKETLSNMVELDDTGALSGSPTHFQERSDFIKLAASKGCEMVTQS